MASTLVRRVCESRMPLDVCGIVLEFVPHAVCERCFVCGIGLVLSDARGRLHYAPHMVCTESVATCTECFEAFYE